MQKPFMGGLALALWVLIAATTPPVKNPYDDSRLGYRRMSLGEGRHRQAQVTLPAVTKRVPAEAERVKNHTLATVLQFTFVSDDVDHDDNGPTDNHVVRVLEERKLAEASRRRNRTLAKAVARRKRAAARRAKEVLNKAAKASSNKSALRRNKTRAHTDTKKHSKARGNHKAATAGAVQASAAARDAARRKAKRVERLRRKREMDARARCAMLPCAASCNVASVHSSGEWPSKCTWQRSCCERRPKTLPPHSQRTRFAHRLQKHSRTREAAGDGGGGRGRGHMLATVHHSLIRVHASCTPAQHACLAG